MPIAAIGPAAVQTSSRLPAQHEAGAARATAVLVNEDLKWDRASPVLGNPLGKVTMVESFDYRCPFCKLMAPKLQRLHAGVPDEGEPITMSGCIDPMPAHGPHRCGHDPVALVPPDGLDRGGGPPGHDRR